MPQAKSISRPTVSHWSSMAAPSPSSQWQSCWLKLLLNVRRLLTMKNTLFDLAGRVALVTGGSKGLGLAMARGFAEAGADIIISSRHENELQAAVAKIKDGTGVRAEYIVADMTERKDVAKLCETALALMKRVDILVNN